IGQTGESLQRSAGADRKLVRRHEAIYGRRVARVADAAGDHARRGGCGTFAGPRAWRVPRDAGDHTRRGQAPLGRRRRHSGAGARRRRAEASRAGRVLPHARFIGYPSGGHLLVGRQKEVTSEMAAFLKWGKTWSVQYAKGTKTSR